MKNFLKLVMASAFIVGSTGCTTYYPATSRYYNRSDNYYTRGNHHKPHYNRQNYGYSNPSGYGYGNYHPTYRYPGYQQSGYGSPQGHQCHDDD